MSSILSTDDGRQNKNKNRYTARKKKLKHNTGKKTKSSSFFLLDDTDECRHNVSKRNKALFSNAEEKKCLGKWETNKKRRRRNSSIVV